MAKPSIPRIKQDQKEPKKIFVTVAGGCPYVCNDTVPPGYELELIDFDNIREGDGYPSREAYEYCKKYRILP